MAGFYRDFTRTTPPDRDALFTNLRALDPTAGPTVTPDGLTVTVKKNTPWTGPQITAAQNAIDTTPALSNTTRFTATSRQKDVLATCALIVRARGIAAWNAMTLPEKKTATFAEADVWVTIRDFVETNL